MTKKTITLGAVNIVCTPHPENVYQDVFRKIKQLNRAVRIRGDRYAKFTTLPEIGSDPMARISGYIATFTQIDMNAPWLDLETDRPAEDKARGGISLPSNLRPNLKEFKFTFDTAKHTLVFVSKLGDDSLSPRSVKSFLDGLFNSLDFLFDDIGIEVTIVPDPNTVNRILKSKSLRQLTIILELPNPDMFGDSVSEIYDNMKSQNMKRAVITQTAVNGEHLVPSASTEALAKIAATNGAVVAKELDLEEATGMGGVDARLRNRDGRVVTVSTRDAPLAKPEVFDDDDEHAYDVFERVANGIVADASATSQTVRRKRKKKRSAK